MIAMHELFEQLEAFDPKWQQHYATLVDAAKAANAYMLYENYAKRPEAVLIDVPDVKGDGERAAAVFYQQFGKFCSRVDNG